MTANEDELSTSATFILPHKEQISKQKLRFQTEKKPLQSCQRPLFYADQIILQCEQIRWLLFLRLSFANNVTTSLEHGAGALSSENDKKMWFKKIFVSA